MLGGVVVTVSLIGISSYRNARITADDLSNQILIQTSASIEQRIVFLLENATAVPEGEIMGTVWQTNKQTLWIGLASLGMAVVVSLVLSGQVARPLEQIEEETESIGRLKLDPRPLVRSPLREVARLARAMEETKGGSRVGARG